MPKHDKDYAGVQEIMRVEYDLNLRQSVLPSMQQFEMYKKWVCWADGVDTDERWIGFCPLHDYRRKHEGSAVFDFWKGMFRCNGEPRCTTGRAISLPNLHAMIAERVLR